MGICKTCKWFTKLCPDLEEEYKKYWHDVCTNSKVIAFIKGEEFDGFVPSPDFGCVLWEAKDPNIQT